MTLSQTGSISNNHTCIPDSKWVKSAKSSSSNVSLRAVFCFPFSRLVQSSGRIHDDLLARSSFASFPRLQNHYTAIACWAPLLSVPLPLLDTSETKQLPSTILKICILDAGSSSLPRPRLATERPLSSPFYRQKHCSSPWLSRTRTFLPCFICLRVSRSQQLTHALSLADLAVAITHCYTSVHATLLAPLLAHSWTTCISPHASL